MHLKPVEKQYYISHNIICGDGNLLGIYLNKEWVTIPHINEILVAITHVFCVILSVIDCISWNHCIQADDDVLGTDILELIISPFA